MSDERKVSSFVHRAKVPSDLLGLTPKEAKTLRDRFGLSLERQPDDVDERTLLGLARKLITIKKKR